MTIKVYPDRIEFGDYTLRSTDQGIEFDGEVEALGIVTLSHGYTSGGGTTTSSTSATNTIDNFPFATDGDATDVGDLTVSRYGVAGQSSDVSGYTSGGIYYPSVYSSVIDRFPFSAGENATTVGDLINDQRSGGGSSSSEYGYVTGGETSPTTLINNIQKFSFASDGNATDGGNLSNLTRYVSGQSSVTHGYTSGGMIFPGPGLNSSLKTIDKFPFASNVDATNIGNLSSTYGTNRATGQSSATHGYASGGDYPLYNSIDKFPFATDADATDIGDLSVARDLGAAGQSSTESGYTSGGLKIPAPSPSAIVIDKFPFATDADATEVGNLSQSRAMDPAGQQG